MHHRAVRGLAWAALAVAAILASPSCGGVSALGEECFAGGETESECEEGVCGKPGDGETLECLVICEEQSDCDADEECNGVEGASVKGCRPKDGKK